MNSVNRTENAAQLRELGMAVCVKLASCPGPNSENAFIDHSTGVLGGGLKLLMVSSKPTMEIMAVFSWRDRAIIMSQ